MRELDLLRHIYGRSADLTGAFQQVLVGPGDDCAVVRAPAGGVLLLKVDQIVEGRHFRPYPATPIDLIARKSVARAVSDIAAMGGTPMCALASVTLPNPCLWADELFDRTAHWARHWGCPLVGGDIATWDAAQSEKSQAGLVLTVSIVGTPHPARGPVLRSGARPGDDLYITGPVGGSLDPETGLGRHLTFEPRIAEAGALCDVLGPRLHAMMDVSDGLGLDASRLAAASGMRIEIDAALIPLAPGLSDWRRGAADGEDYELIFAAERGAVDSASAARPVRIGSVVEGSGCVIVENGRAHDAGKMGWLHG